MRARIKKEISILNRLITEKNYDIMKMINLSAQAEMLLRKKDLSVREAESMEEKLYTLIESNEEKRTKNNLNKKILPGGLK